MTLKSVREDLQARTLSAIAGLLAKLAYLAGLRQDDGSYSHWGLSRVYGEESAQRALGEAHKSALSTVLRTPISQLQADVEQSSKATTVSQESFVDELQKQESFVDELQKKEAQLLPLKPGAGSRRHLSSVLQALSALVRHSH